MCLSSLLKSLFCIALVIVDREVSDIGHLNRNISKDRS